MEDRDEEFDPFAIGGYAELDEEVAKWRLYMKDGPPQPKIERQMGLFQRVVEAMERENARKEKGDG